MHAHPRMLAVHRYLFRLAGAAGNLFGWIIVFRVLLLSGDFTRALAGTALLYAFAQAFCFFLTPLSGAALRHGTRRALILGSLAQAASFGFLALLFLVPSALGGVFWLAAGFALMQGISRAVYFVPYAAAAAHAHDERPHALLREFSLVLVPLAAAFLAAAAGFGFLFAIAAALALAASLAAVEMSNTYERFDLSYGDALRALFSFPHRGAFGIALFDGLQGATLLLLWPLAVYLILSGSLILLGAVLSATFLFALVGRWLLRRSHHPRRSPYVLAAIAFSSWVFRLPAGTPLQIVAADVVYHSAADPRGQGIDAHASDQAADNGHYIDEKTALKEMGQSLGRIVMCLIFAAVTLTLAPVIGFAVCIAAAAVAAAASVLFSHHLKKEAF